MASAWGLSWGSAWGDSWGIVGEQPATGGHATHKPRKSLTREEVAERVRKQREDFGVIPREVARVVEEIAEAQVDDRTLERTKRALRERLEAEQLGYERAYFAYLQAMRDALLTEQIARMYDEIAMERDQLAQAIEVQREAERLALIELEAIRLARKRRLMAFVLLNA